MIERALNDTHATMLIDFNQKRAWAEVSKAFVKKLVDKYGEAIYVSIPFRGNEGTEARLGYLISNRGCRALLPKLLISKEKHPQHFIM